MFTPRVRRLLASVLFVSLFACSGTQTVPHRPPKGVPHAGSEEETAMSREAPPTREPSGGPSEPFEEPPGPGRVGIEPPVSPGEDRILDPVFSGFEGFCREVARLPQKTAVVGCLPLVSYDLRREGPWVSDLGVRLSEAIGDGILREGFQGTVLRPDDMEAHLTKRGFRKVAFSSQAEVASHDELLGVDVIVFGTIRRDRNVGATARDVLTIEVTAYDKAAGRMQARKRLEVPSDRFENTKAFELAQRESLWEAGTQWNVPPVNEDAAKQ